MSVSEIKSGKPNERFASPLSEQSGISLDVKNTLAPVPPANRPLIGSYPPGESSFAFCLNGSYCPKPEPVPVPSSSSPKFILSYSNGIPVVKSLGNILYTPLSITLTLIISPTGLPSFRCNSESAVTTLITSNLATLSGKPFPEPIFAVHVAGVAVELGSKSITLTLGGFSIE